MTRHHLWYVQMYIEPTKFVIFNNKRSGTKSQPKRVEPVAELDKKLHSSFKIKIELLMLRKKIIIYLQKQKKRTKSPC